MLAEKAINISQQSISEREQVECPVTHHFGPGIYIREVFMPANTVVVGRTHKHKNLNILMRGSIALLSENGSLDTLTGPFIFTGKPGRKIGYTLEDVVWQNIHATEETDLRKIEDFFIEKEEDQEQLEHDVLRLEKAMNKFFRGLE